MGRRTTVVVKGPKDVISDGTRTIVCDVRGSPRRAGGQGDVLAGLLLTFKVWALILKSPLYAVKTKKRLGKTFSKVLWALILKSPLRGGFM